jgi:hypothetical protein
MKIHILHYTYSKFFQGNIFLKITTQKLLDDTFHKYFSISSIMQDMQIKCLV